MKEITEKLPETKSNWDCVAEMMQHASPIDLGKNFSEKTYKAPRQLLNILSYYKFAARMIGSHKRVLDSGCQEGLGTWVVAKECGFCKGIDKDLQAIQTAQKNFSDSSVEFVCESLSQQENKKWDAVIHFGPYESKALAQIVQILSEEGLVVIGSTTTERERVEAHLRELFDFIFLFSAHGQVIHPENVPSAPYVIAIGCKKKT